jgi:uncharacterized membrane protein
MAVALLALVGGFVALYLTLYKVGVIGELSCTIGSCETVNTSRWSTLLGLPVAAWGLGAYAVMLALALVGLQPAYSDSRPVSWALVAVSGWSVLFSAWLTSLELFVIHAICIWCVTSAAIVTLIFVASLADLLATRGTRAPRGDEATAARRSRLTPARADIERHDGTERAERGVASAAGRPQSS